MNINPITSKNFSGLLVVTAPGKEHPSATAIETSNIVTIEPEYYYSANFQVFESSLLTLNNGTFVKVPAPVSKVIEAYDKAAKEDMCQLELDSPAVVQRPFL